MKRLYNEYSAAPYEGAVAQITDIIEESVDRIWKDIVEAQDICPRDAESLCHSVIDIEFSHRVLRKAFTKHKQERKELTIQTN